MKYKSLVVLSLLHLPDIGFLIYIALIFINNDRFDGKLPANIPLYYIYILAGFFLIKVVFIIIIYKSFYLNSINTVNNIISRFRQGQFTRTKKEKKNSNELSGIINELSVIGKYVDNTIVTLKEEIENFRELYNNIVFTISSYLIILNEKDEIFFINDAFSKKFQFDLDEIGGKKLEDIFYFFANHKVMQAVVKVRGGSDSVVLEKTHLLSKNRTSIIADIKISSMLVQGERQVVMIIDDITHRYQKDYQINLMSQVTGSIQKEQEIPKLLYAILYGITSGAGIGFNRAMLFLYNRKLNSLVGEMAVGPDSMEEAIEIWEKVANESFDTSNMIDSFSDPDRKGRKLVEKVLNASFDVRRNSLVANSFKDLDIIHVINSYEDNRVDAYLREFLDVNEFVIVPLILDNRSIGVVFADNKFNQLPIGDDHVKLLTIFAGQAALLIESHRSLSTVKGEMEKMGKRQEAIVESEKLAAIGRIAAHIAHEIRNPLVTMGGYATRIQMLMEDNNNYKEVKKAAGIILKETERLENFLFNVMDLTRPPELIKKLNDLNKVITDTIELLKNLFMESRIHIEENLNPDLPLFNSDFNQMKQVVLNLLQNAIDATPENGKIIIETHFDTRNIAISIKDNGTGIAEEDFDKVFDPFFTTKITGVGLGLSIVHKIIKDHSGEISFRNRNTGGVEFIIRFPVST